MRIITGCTYYAVNYREDVTIVKIERGQHKGEPGRYLVERPDGSRTSNYPGYLLGPRKGNA